jgi:DMSO reductase anchor subunit
MHPASSVILFTTSAGAGYGLLFLIALAAPHGMLPLDMWFGVISIGLALVLITIGLLSSTFHLAHPERAWRAMSQWRSSWLSREGVAALFTYIPAVLYAGSWVFLEETRGSWPGLIAVRPSLPKTPTGLLLLRSQLVALLMRSRRRPRRKRGHRTR